MHTKCSLSQSIQKSFLCLLGGLYSVIQARSNFLFQFLKLFQFIFHWILMTSKIEIWTHMLPIIEFELLEIFHSIRRKQRGILEYFRGTRQLSERGPKTSPRWPMAQMFVHVKTKMSPFISQCYTESLFAERRFNFSFCLGIFFCVKVHFTL